MAVTYRLLVDFPGVPAGELLIKAGAIYLGATHPSFWMHANVVEGQASQPVALPTLPTPVTPVQLFQLVSAV